MEYNSNPRAYSPLSKNHRSLQLCLSIRGHLRKSPLSGQLRPDSFLVPEPWGETCWAGWSLAP